MSFSLADNPQRKAPKLAETLSEMSARQPSLAENLSGMSPRWTDPQRNVRSPAECSLAGKSTLLRLVFVLSDLRVAVSPKDETEKV